MQQQQQQHTIDLQDEVGAYKRSFEEQRQRHAAQIKELCAEAKEEEERQRSRALSTQWHDHVLAAQRELVEFAVDKLLLPQGGGFLQASPPQPVSECAQAEDIRQEARERVTAAVADMSAQVQHLVRSKNIMQWQLAVKDSKLEALLQALDSSLTAQTIAQNRYLALQRAAQAQRAGEDGCTPDPHPHPALKPHHPATHLR